MKIKTLRLSNFQSFGPKPTAIDLDELMFVLGPNGSGKTAVLEALSRLFSPLLAQRRIHVEDFHVPADKSAGQVQQAESTLWLEVDVVFPEAADDEPRASIPPNFSHMALESADAVPRTRIRLTATLAPDGFIDEKIEYVLQTTADGEPTRTADMSRYDRGYIEVHYLPARRDPADHISYTTASLIGRTLRAADWSAERVTLSHLSEQITSSLAANPAVDKIGVGLAGEWQGLHGGAYLKDPSIGFGQGELEGVLRQLTVTFSPTHAGAPLPFDRLSDGQKSLLYISLVLAWQALARRVLSGEEPSLDADRLRPPVHTVIALEEPENSLAPQYLGRIIRQVRGACAQGDVQSVIATHAPALLRRVDPTSICFLRLNALRETTVCRAVLPADDDEAAKYVREAVQAYPELYFSRFVVLGEGASEQVVLPRILAAAGIAEDDASVSIVPLGGRHVNHFWRLLNELQVPHATLLDLDAGRYHGGWGRVRNALRQVNKIQPGSFKEANIKKLPKWNDDHSFPELVDDNFKGQRGPVKALEEKGVFFSSPVDLDLMMLAAYPDAYGPEASDLGATTDTEQDEDPHPGEETEEAQQAGSTPEAQETAGTDATERPPETPTTEETGETEATEEGAQDEAASAPSEATLVAVLGKSHANEGRLPDEVLTLFDRYHTTFNLGSKPSAHLSALARLTDEQLSNDLPDVLARLVEHVGRELAGLPE